MIILGANKSNKIFFIGSPLNRARIFHEGLLQASMPYTLQASLRLSNIAPGDIVEDQDECA